LFDILFCTSLPNYTTLQPLYGSLSGTTRVSQYQKKHSPTHHPDHHPIFTSFFHLLRSIASSLFKPRVWQFFAQPLSTSSLVYVLVWSHPPHTPYISSPNQCLFRSTCPYHRNLFCCITKNISSIPSLSLKSTWHSIFYLLTHSLTQSVNLSFALSSHIRLTIVISSR